MIYTKEEAKEKYGRVWNTKELTTDFEVISFLAPFVMVKERSTEKKGTMIFQHSPRLYFSFEESK